MIRATGDYLAQSIETRHRPVTTAGPKASIAAVEDGRLLTKQHSDHPKVDNKEVEDDRCIDWKRVVVTSGYGAVFNGILGHLWYENLDFAVRRFFTAGTRKFVASKVLADSVVFGPVHIIAFFTFVSLAEGGSMEDALEKIKADFVPTFGVELGVWPIVQTVNFWKVPLQYQLLVVNGVTVLDAAFMSWVQHNDVLMKRWKMWMSTGGEDD